MNANGPFRVKSCMKTTWGKRCWRGFLLFSMAGAALGLAGCADEYVGYPAYRGGYYASYAAAPYPYYGAGYGYPYRAYGPYYGGYGYPYYGGSSVIISGSRSYVYRDRYGRVRDRRANQQYRRTTRNQQQVRGTRTRSTTVRQYQNDDERRYYTPR